MNSNPDYNVHFKDKYLRDSFSLELLKNVSEDMVSLLRASGFFTLKDLVIQGPFEISSKVGLGLEDSIFIHNQAISFLEEIGVMDRRFTPATTLYNKRKRLGRVSTGSSNFDKLLGGGIETNAITEFYGEYGTGKTQLCHTICVIVQQNYSSGGLGAGALYIDTENTFRPERIESIAISRGLDPIKILDNIIVAKAYSSSHQELILSEVSKIIDSNNIRLLVLDSAISLFRSEFLGLSTLSARQQQLNKLIHTIMRITETHGIAAVLTNQVQSSPDSLFTGGSFKAAGGNILAHSSTYRIFLRKSNRNRIARIVDSPNHPESETLFYIGESGVSDPKT